MDRKFKCVHCGKKEATEYDLRCNGWQNQRDERLLSCDSCNNRSSVEA